MKEPWAPPKADPHWHTDTYPGMRDVNEQSSKAQRAKRQPKCYQMVVISNFCPAISLIFLYFFNSILRTFPHIRWFTAALALNTGGEVSELVKVGDDSWGQTAYPRARRRRRGCDLRGLYSALFFRAMENGGGWQMFVHVCACMCVLELETRQSHRQWCVCHWCPAALPRQWWPTYFI